MEARLAVMDSAYLQRPDAAGYLASTGDKMPLQIRTLVALSSTNCLGASDENRWLRSLFVPVRNSVAWHLAASALGATY
jgi:hypothetical protein